MNSYTVFTQTKKAFDDLFSELSTAKKSIYIETFTLKNDSVGRKLVRILAQQSKEIPVILIVDHMGLKKLSKQTKKILETSNIEFIIFNPWNTVLRKVQLRRLIDRIMRRNHRKITLIDNKIGYVGGLNYNAKELQWRDILVKCKGEIVKDLSKISKEFLVVARKNVFEKRTFNKTLNKNFSSKDVILRQVPHTTYPQTFKKSIRRLITQANKEICITTPYFIPPIQVLNWLIDKAKKGVKVTVLIPQKTDHKGAQILNMWCSYLAQRENISIFLYEKMTHAKYIVVDGKACTVGSANYDHQTWFSNYELNLFTKNKTVVHALQQTFKEDVDKSISFEAKKHYHNRPLWEKIIGVLIKPIKKFF